jgi:phosphatidylglycerol:prolipoprotein diacylglycerol transferase
VHKVAFQLGDFTLYWYGVLVAVGFLAGLWTASRRAPLTGIPSEQVADLGPWLMLGGLAGSRLLYVLAFWQEDFAGKPWWEIFMIRRGGLVFYGGLCGAALACIGYVRWRRLSLWKLADVLAPSIPLGQFFGRLGCLMYGCCYGRACDLPWAIRFPSGHETFPQPVHPAQLYESVLCLGLYGALTWFYRRQRFAGQVFALYLIAYAPLRFLVEFFRGDHLTRYLGGWATSGQLFSLGVLGAGLVVYRLLRTRRRPGQGSPR